jgi:hypothetical protein
VHTQALRLCIGRTAHRWSRGLDLFFLDHGTRRGCGFSVTPRPLFTPRKDLVPIVQEAGWVPGPVWTGAENLSPTGIRSWTFQPVGCRYTDWTTRPTLGCKLTINQVSINIMYYFRDCWINIGRETKMWTSVLCLLFVWNLTKFWFYFCASVHHRISQIKHQLDSTLCGFYFSRVTLHVSGVKRPSSGVLKN